MTLTENYTFQLSDTGVVLNGTSVTPFVDITRVVGLDSAPYRETIRDHEGYDGGFMDASLEKGREVLLEGDVYASPGSVETYLDSLKANFAPVSNPIPFYLLSEGSVANRLLFVKPRGAHYEWSSERRTGRVPIQFTMYAEDPRVYDSVLNSATISFGATVSNGFGFPLGFPFGFGGTSGASDGVAITNSGNRPTPAVLTITGPVDQPQVINDTVSLTLQFAITLTSVDTLTIDLGTHAVTLNGTANRRGTLVAPNWFLIQPGSNFIRFRGASGSAPSSLTIQYRSAWR